MDWSIILEGLLIGVLGVVGIFFYMIPTLLAKGKPHRDAIFVLNLLLGWTLIGWVGALVWAMVDPQTQPASSAPPFGPLLCAYCGRYSEPVANFCASCGKPFRLVETSLPQDQNASIG